MVKFSEYLNAKRKINEVNTQVQVLIDIENDEKLMNTAMKAKNVKDLEDKMSKMKMKFSSKVDFDKINWDNVYKRLNELDEAVSNIATEIIDEGEITEGLFNKLLDAISPSKNDELDNAEDAIRQSMIDAVNNLKGISADSKKEVIRKLKKL